MSEGLAIALITAGCTLLGTLVTVILTQLVRLNGRLRRLERRDRLSWLYIRTLIVHANKHAPNVPLPEPPEGWLEDTEN